MKGPMSRRQKADKKPSGVSERTPLVLASKVAQVANLLGLEMIAGSFRLRRTTPSERKRLEREGSLGMTRQDHSIHGDLLSALTGFSLIALLPKSKADGLCVDIAADFQLRYRLPKPRTLSNEEIRCFARVNSIFNSWSYWREFVQSSMARMNLPQPCLPLMTAVGAVKLAGLLPQKDANTVAAK